jgi:hypothetical protein
LNNRNTENESPPRVTEKEIRFSYLEPICGILFAIAAAVIFLGFPQIIAVVFVSGPLIPTFDTEVIRSLWIPVILWVLLRVAVEVFYLIERRYTKRLAIVTMTGNTLAFICTLILFIPARIVNAEYVDWIHTYFADSAAIFGEILAAPHIVIIVIMLIGLILDSITVTRKGFKKKKEKNEDEPAEDTPAEDPPAEDTPTESP